MIFIYILHIIVALVLIKKSYSRGLKEALPFFCLVLILSPGEAQIRISGIFDISLQRTAVTVLFFLYLFLKDSRKNYINRDLKVVKYLIIVAIAWQLLANFNSIVPVTSFKRMVAYLLEFYLVYFILVNTIDDLKTVYKVISSIVLAMTIACIFGIIELYSGWSPKDLLPHEVGRFELMRMGVTRFRMRINSLFPHAILFGGAIVLTVPLAFHILKIYHKRWQKSLIWFSIIIMMFCLFKTDSRGPWLALGLSLILLFIFHQQSRKYLITLFLITSFVLIVRPGLWNYLEAKLNATLDPTTPTGSSYEYRYVLYKVVIEAVSREFSRTLYGYGQDSFFYLDLETEFKGKPYKFLSCDSAWAAILIESGYIGLFIMLFLFGWIFYAHFKNYFTVMRPYNSLNAIFFIIFFAFNFMMLSVNTLSFGQLGIYLWILIALSMAYIQITNNIGFLEQEEFEEPDLNINELREV